MRSKPISCIADSRGAEVVGWLCCHLAASPATVTVATVVAIVSITATTTTLTLALTRVDQIHVGQTP